MKRKILIAAIGLFMNIQQTLIQAESAHYYSYILAGGNGERLWPLSRQQKPKQLLKLGSELTLLEQTIDRIGRHVKNDNISVVTTQQHVRTIIESTLLRQPLSFVIEPAARNTGPAMLYAAISLYEKDPDAIIMFLHADSFIPKSSYELFDESMRAAFKAASEQDVIVLVGVAPTYPATGYGYIEYDTLSTESVRNVIAFYEKPSQENAQKYLDQGNMLWNVGMFCSKAKVFIDECRRVCPELYNDIMTYKRGDISYDAITSIAIDYAVMEKSKNILVVPATFDWCDVGNVGIFLSLKNEHESLSDRVIAIDASNNLVDVPEKLVAIVGVNDLCIIESQNALLITKREDAEKVRSVISQIKQSGWQEYL
jgi:mannose-1-phosphate guanylyltransferase